MSTENGRVKRFEGTEAEVRAQLIVGQRGLATDIGALITKTGTDEYNYNYDASGKQDKSPVDQKIYALENGGLTDITDSLGASEVVTITEDTTAETEKAYRGDTSSQAITLTLPTTTAEGDVQGRIIKVTGIDSDDITVVGTGGQLIAGKSSQLINGESEGFTYISNGSGYDIWQDNRGGIQRKLSQSTSIISGYEVSQNATDSNAIDIAAGIFSREVPAVTPIPPNNADLSNPVSSTYKTPAITKYVVPNYTTDGFTTLQITESGTVIPTLNKNPSLESQSQNPRIAVVVHFGGIVNSVQPWWTAGQNPTTRLLRMMNKIGIIKEGLSVFGASAANLQIANDSGTLFYGGAEADKRPNNPDEQDVSASDPIQSFILAKQDATVNPSQTLIDPTQIDVGGTLTPLAGNDKVSIQRIYSGLEGTIAVQYGQNSYATIQDALTALIQKEDTFVEYPVFNDGARLISYLIVDRLCTDLTDDNTARFLESGKYDESASSSSAIQLIDLQKALENGNTANIAMYLDATGKLDEEIVFRVIKDAISRVSIYGDGRLQALVAAFEDLYAMDLEVGNELTVDGKSFHGEKIDHGALINVQAPNSTGYLFTVIGGANNPAIEGIYTYHSTGSIDYPTDAVYKLGDNYLFSATVTLSKYWFVGAVVETGSVAFDGLSTLYQTNGPALLPNGSSYSGRNSEIGKTGSMIETNIGVLGISTDTFKSRGEATTNLTAEQVLANGDQQFVSIGSLSYNTVTNATNILAGWVPLSGPFTPRQVQNIIQTRVIGAIDGSTSINNNDVIFSISDTSIKSFSDTALVRVAIGGHYISVPVQVSSGDVIYAGENLTGISQIVVDSVLPTDPMQDLVVTE